MRDPLNITNPVVFFDVQIGNKDVGRIHFELFVDDCPKTCENFRQFCNGEHLKETKGIEGPEYARVWYKGATFHKVVHNSYLEGGDIFKGDGSGSYSIYDGQVFDDENMGDDEIKHDRPGLLCMANKGPNKNGCQFMITCNKMPELDGSNVVFGRVMDGIQVVRKIEKVPVDKDNRPTAEVRIWCCGQL